MMYAVSTADETDAGFRIIDFSPSRGHDCFTMKSVRLVNMIVNLLIASDN